MVPHAYNMVSLDNLDLAEANGDIVEGIYSKILDAMDACGVLMIVNWRFAGIQIAPSYCSILQFDGYITLNGVIKITSSDEVFIEGVYPPPPEPPDPVIVPVQFTENGEYEVPEGVDGYNPVTVAVPISEQIDPELFKYIAVSNKSGDKFIRDSRNIVRNTNSLAIGIIIVYLTGSTINYSGYGAITLTDDVITGTATSYGQFILGPRFATPNGTNFWVQTMAGSFPPSSDSGKIKFQFDSSNYYLEIKPQLNKLVYSGVTQGFIGDESLISALYVLIDYFATLQGGTI